MCKNSLLKETYSCFKEEKIVKNLSDFFDLVFPNGVISAYSSKTKEKYISKESALPQKVKKYFENKENKRDILKHYDNLKNEIDSTKIVAAYRIMINILDENKQTDLSQALINVIKMDRDMFAEVFYCYFRYCITLIAETDVGNTTDIVKQDLEEFISLIVNQYGVSSFIGRKIILNMAENGCNNTYILFEAAEIMYRNVITGNGSNDNIRQCLNRAYNYYVRASKGGHPLAAWSVGYMIQMSYEKNGKLRSWKI